MYEVGNRLLVWYAGEKLMAFIRARDVSPCYYPYCVKLLKSGSLTWISEDKIIYCFEKGSVNRLVKDV